MAITLADINQALHDVGLTPRGAFHPGAEDNVPDLSDGQPAGTLVLAGNAGPAVWTAFSAARDPDTELLDDWSRDVIAPLAERLGAAALFPFQKPHLPFQRWAQKAESCHASPLGMFIHPDHGLWHGYRGALVFSSRLALAAADNRPSPCDSCTDKPCLTTCPVAAFTTAGYDVPTCARHLDSSAGVDCMAEGCRARRACPQGDVARYHPAQAAFHMRAFLKARRADGSLN
ncbi:MAG: 4Fe-4S dicluster domain-containing protein [Rhodospirillaceae bacterium]|jgi:hypothetical protein|nr:4Fe-4S dicluster domain-containing protein [Rhodospirillaceae bacterium]